MNTQLRTSILGIALILLAVGCTSGPRKTTAQNNPTVQNTNQSGQGDDLFDSTTNGDEQPTGDGTQTVLTEQEQQCLSNGLNLQQPCWAQATDEESMYRMILASYQGLSDCIDMANSIAPNATATPQQVRSAFEIGSLVIARCARQIVSMQMTMPLGNQHLLSLSNNDYLLWQFVQQMSQGK